MQLKNLHKMFKSIPGKTYKLNYIKNFIDSNGYSFDVNNFSRTIALLDRKNATKKDFKIALENKATVDRVPYWLIPYIVKHAVYLIENEKRAWESKEFLFSDLISTIEKEKNIKMSIP